MALTTWVPTMKIKIGKSNDHVKGLGLLPNIRVIPHFDRMLGWIPDFITRYLVNTPPGVTLVGIEENTAIVGGIDHWVVKGKQSVWVIGKERRSEYKVGDTFSLESDY
jgi:cyanophycinase-like exopeptidase